MTDRAAEPHHDRGDDDVLRAVAWVGPELRPMGVPSIALSDPGRGALLRDAMAIRRAGVEIALIQAQSARLGDLAAACTLGGVAGVVGFLDGEPPARLNPSAGRGPPGVHEPRWWHRRIHRFACADAESAREWGRAGIALGRIVVIPPGPSEREALEAIVREVRSMAR